MKHLIEKYENKIQQLKRASIEDPTGLIAQRIADFKEFIQDLKQEPFEFKKWDVCVYVESQDHLIELTNILEANGERLDYVSSSVISDDSKYRYLRYSLVDKDFYVSVKGGLKVITTEQFKKLWQ